MSNKLKVLSALALAGGVLGASSAYAAFALPTGYVTYGDGQSYALQVSGTLAGDTGPGSPFYVASTPGAIKDLTVLATGASGGGVNTNTFGTNDAFATPSGVSGSTYFQTGGATVSPDPGSTPGFANPALNNLAKSWDMELSALKSFLSGSDMILFFNNNQTDSGPDTNQTLAAWAVLWLTDPNGNIVAGAGGSTGIYEFTNRGGLFATVGATVGPYSSGGILSTSNPNAASAFSSAITDPLNDLPRINQPSVLGPTVNLCFDSGTQTVTTATLAAGCATGQHFIGTTELTDYVMSGGPICVNAAETAIVPCGTTGSKTINNNLGANQAAYALLFPELNASMNTLFGNGALNLDNYSLHVRVQLGCDPRYTTTEECTAHSLNNGYEQIFMAAANQVQTPEPKTMLLLAMGLVLAGVFVRRERGTTGKRMH